MNPLHTYKDEYYVSHKSVIEKSIYFHPDSSNIIIHILPHTLSDISRENLSKTKDTTFNNTFATLLTAMLACYRRLEILEASRIGKPRRSRGEGRFLLRPPLHFAPRRNRFPLCIKGVRKNVFKSRCYVIFVNGYM